MREIKKDVATDNKSIVLGIDKMQMALRSHANGLEKCRVAHSSNIRIKIHVTQADRQA